MPTYRKLHTRILESQDIADMPDDFHRLVWTWLPLILTSDGTTIYDAHYVRSRMFPLRDDITPERIGQVLAWFDQRRMILPYDGDGRRYLFVPTFAKYQGDTTREADSTFPKPPADLAATHVIYMQSACNAPVIVAQSVCSDTDADTNANADTNTLAAPLVVKPLPKRVIDHETVPEPELLREIQHAFQRGTGQDETQALPGGTARTTLRQLLDDKRTPADIEGYARYLKTGWWIDKSLPIAKLAEGIGQWIAQGRPAKANGQARASPQGGHVSQTVDIINQMIAEERAHATA
jgi:hypothetical protein